MTITYQLMDSAGGKFALNGNEIVVAAALPAGSHTIAVKATDENGWSKTFSIPITVDQVGNPTPSTAGQPIGLLLTLTRAS